MARLLLALCFLPTLASCVPYFGNLARDFGAVATSPGSDLTPMLRNLGQLCKRHSDLAYLRSRLEDPNDKALVPWRSRGESLFGDRQQGIEARCASLDVEIARYQLMQSAITSYGMSLRALAETQGVDFRESLSVMGNSLSLLSRQIYPSEPELGRIFSSSSRAVNQLLMLSLAQKSESDIKKAILAAEEPMEHLLTRLARALSVYEAQMRHYVLVQRALLERLERGTLAKREGRPVDLLLFYSLAQRAEDDERRMGADAKAYKASLASLGAAHKTMVEAAKGKIPPKKAFQMVQRSFRSLLLELSEISYELQNLYLRRMR